MYSLRPNDIAADRGRTMAAPSSNARINDQSLARFGRSCVCSLTVESIVAVLKCGLGNPIAIDGLNEVLSTRHRGSPQLAVLLTATDRVAFVMLLLAPRHAQLDFGAPVFEVNCQWDQGCALCF